VNDSDFFSVNDNDSLSMNNDDSLSVNDNSFFSVNDDDSFSINNDDFLSVNNSSLYYHFNFFFVIKHKIKVIVNVDIIVCFSSYNIFTLKNNIYNNFSMMILFLINIFNIHVTHL